MFIGEEDDLDEAAGQDHGQEAEHGRFLHDLADQGWAECAECFFEAHFFGADGGTGGDEVDVVNNGQ